MHAGPPYRCRVGSGNPTLEKGLGTPAEARAGQRNPAAEKARGLFRNDNQTIAEWLLNWYRLYLFVHF